MDVWAFPFASTVAMPTSKPPPIGEARARNEMKPERHKMEPELTDSEPERTEPSVTPLTTTIRNYVRERMQIEFVWDLINYTNMNNPKCVKLYYHHCYHHYYHYYYCFIIIIITTIISITIHPCINIYIYMYTNNNTNNSNDNNNNIDRLIYGRGGAWGARRVS